MTFLSGPSRAGPLLCEKTIYDPSLSPNQIENQQVRGLRLARSRAPVSILRRYRLKAAAVSGHTVIREAVVRYRGSRRRVSEAIRNPVDVAVGRACSSGRWWKPT